MDHTHAPRARSYFDPENLQALAQLFEKARAALIASGKDTESAREIVASSIFKLAAQGGDDPAIMLETALSELELENPGL